MALLDTHALLWWQMDDRRLSQSARDFIGTANNRLWLSVATVWEITLKAQIGKLTLPEEPSVFIPDRIMRTRLQCLDITLAHALHTYTLPLHHRDPFDRILVAQSMVERLPIITADPLIAQYPVQVIW